MQLGDIYERSVKKDGISTSFGSQSFSFPSIERDPTIVNLENSVFQQLMSIAPKEEPIQKTSEVSYVSVEDAIRQLLEMEKNK